MKFSIDIKFNQTQQRALAEHAYKYYILPSLIKTSRELKASDFGKTLLQFIESTELVRGLRGAYAGDKQKDYQAILGLSDYEVEAFVGLSKSYILDKLSIKVDRARKGITIGLLTKPEIEAFYEQDFGKYASYPSEEIIEWLKWITYGVNDPVIDVDILFAVNAKYDISEHSRSGRAIMVEAISNDWNIGDYDLPNNFLKDALERDDLVQKMSNDLESLFLKNMRAL